MKFCAAFKLPILAPRALLQSPRLNLSKGVERRNAIFKDIIVE
jgi:hypothetical protein